MVTVIDSTDLKLGKHAYSQMKDFGVDPEVKKTEALNIPRSIAQSRKENFLVLMRTDQKFTEEVVAKIMDLEEKKKVAKVFVERNDEGREVFEKRAERLAREKAEKLAEKVR